MNTYFDSNVLVSRLNVNSPHHTAAVKALAAAGKGAGTSTHALAETYRTLTTLKQPIPPRAATELVLGLLEKLDVRDIPAAAYTAALQEVARQGLAGAIVYDAVHCFAARQFGAVAVVTRNGPHFRLFAGNLMVTELV